MRTEKEMMNLILGTAQRDERIRAVIMNGSRVNPNVKSDIFQDYDIVYIVKNIDSITRDHSWIDVFGERIILQMPEGKVMPPPLGDGRWTYLMWFKDGNRIDLTLIPLEKREALMQPDSLSKLLLDKDGIIGTLPPASDNDYHIQKPTEQEYQDLCNEFWWIAMNISKGLWRRELPYAMFMYETINRNVLVKMLEWQVGTDTNFNKNTGSFGKYLEHHLNEGDWTLFISTFSRGDYDEIWNALFAMCNLFRKASTHVAEQLGFTYPDQDDENVTAHLRHIRNLPPDAKEIY